MKPNVDLNEVEKKKYSAMYEVLIAHSDARYGDPAFSSGLVKHIASFLGPRPTTNNYVEEAIQAYMMRY